MHTIANKKSKNFMSVPRQQLAAQNRIGLTVSPGCNLVADFPIGKIPHVRTTTANTNDHKTTENTVFRSAKNSRRINNDSCSD
jgi:hypothetical protein